MEKRNLVLYRKYRPKTFSEIIGQGHVVKTLTNAISRGLVSHAYLFHGPRGSGKTTIARLLAKAVNCEKRKDGEYEPCNECLSCREINEGKALDLIEIDAASNRGIDEIRELRDGIKFVPTRLKYKVFIIDESHQLTKEAANALLKILEEPPSHVIFILATTEIHKMIPTILSRCQRFDFKKLTVGEIVKKLEFISKNEKIDIEKKALELIALNSEGSIRDAESILDQVISFLGTSKRIKVEDIKSLLGTIETKVIGDLIDLILEKKAKESIEYLNAILEKGYDTKEILNRIIEYLREAMLLKINPVLENPFLVSFTKEEKEKLLSQVKKTKEEDFRKMIKIFLEAEGRMRFSPITQLPLEIAILEACQI